MNRVIAAGVLLLGPALAGPALAQAEAGPPGASAAASAYAGQFAQTCAACHGDQGRSAMPLTPSLGGQPSFYTITQLFLFRDGRRDNPAMTAVAKTMSDDDLRGFSDFIATLPPPPASASAPDAARFARGRALAGQHLCDTCHGPDYAGGTQVARLAHQREDYLLLALKGFKSGMRPGYTPAMAEALQGIQPEELGDLAHYLAHHRARDAAHDGVQGAGRKP